MRSSDTAIKCFDENRALFGDPRANPEKYNLYNGLASLSEAVLELQSQLHQLRQEVHQLRYEISQLKH
jgi:hypothetical protein